MFDQGQLFLGITLAACHQPRALLALTLAATTALFVDLVSWVHPAHLHNVPFTRFQAFQDDHM
jgi:hypothetical protein